MRASKEAFTGVKPDAFPNSESAKGMRECKTRTPFALSHFSTDVGTPETAEGKTSAVMSSHTLRFCHTSSYTFTPCAIMIVRVPPVGIEPTASR